MTQKTTFRGPLLALSTSVLFAFSCLDLDAEDGSGGATQGGARTSGGSAGQVMNSGGTLTAGGSSNQRGGSSGATSTGGRAQETKGGANQGGANRGGELNTGGDAGTSGEGGAEAGGGAGPAAGAAGGPGGEGGSGGAGPVEEPLCSDSDGNPISSDVLYGLATEYAFALSMSCEIGGYLAPLVAADPVDLKEVDAFVRDLTDWYRAEILHCAGVTSPLTPDGFGLLPSSESSDATQTDVDASVNLFMAMTDRHDTQPDAVDPVTKQKIRERLKSKADKAVHNAKDELTKPLAPPDCVPADPPNGSR